jgi:alpha-L-arabinofuranosidase
VLVSLPGADLRAYESVVLTHDDIHAQNTFDEPDNVVPRESREELGGGSSFRHAFPPASVTRLTLELA